MNIKKREDDDDYDDDKRRSSKDQDELTYIGNHSKSDQGEKPFTILCVRKVKKSLILLLVFLLLMDPPEVDVSPRHRCIDEDVDDFRINLPPPSPPRFFPRSSQLVVLVCGHRWPQVRRQCLTSPNDRFFFF